MSGTCDPAWIATAVQLACLLEASAAKPGNVSPGRPFHDTRYEDFLASAAAIGPAFLEVAERPLGATIRRAVEDTARLGVANTNLGIVLLLAPLARAARLGAGAGASLRARVHTVLADTTVADARNVYAAIRVARPGGLGRAAAQDVSAEPTVTLSQAMTLAAGRDDVAHEYATGYAITFELGAPALRRARTDGLGWDDAVVELYLMLLAERPDTLIARKAGADAAAAVAVRARAARQAGGVRSAAGREALARLDRELRGGRNRRNPGTTADLTAAAILAVLIEDGWP